jgi:hypothetical protein
MAYDAADHYVVLLQPRGEGSWAGTWTYSSGRWTLLNISSEPAICLGASLAYDPTASVVVFFGPGDCGSENQTWTFSAGLWTRLSTIRSPGYIASAAVAYDLTFQGVILFGGYRCHNGTCTGQGVDAGTWKFAGGGWTNISASLRGAPPAAGGWSASYDAADGYLLLFGRNASTGQIETWKLNATGWSQLSTSGAPPSGAGDVGLPMAYDPIIPAVLLFGATSTGQAGNSTWEYSAGVWKNANPSVSPAPGSWTMLFDPVSNLTILFGIPSTQELWLDAHGQTWTSSGGSWTPATQGFGPPALGQAGLTYDAAEGAVVFFGGYSPDPSGSGYWGYLNVTWTYRDGTWTNVTHGAAPQGRGGEGFVYDAAGGFVLLFGGQGLTGPDSRTGSLVYLSDTWEWLNGTWSRLSPALHPPAGSYAQMVYDGADGYVLLLCGAGGPSYTWVFVGGNWTNLSSTVTNAPSFASPSLTYDAADGYVLLFGLYTTSAPYRSNVTWMFKGGHWTNLSATGSVKGSPPEIAVGSPMAYDAALGEVVLYCLFVSLGGPPCSLASPGEVYEYAAGTWTLVRPVVGPPEQADPALTYDAADGVILMVGGSNQSAATSDTWAFGGSTGSTPLQVGSFYATTNPDDVGVATTIEATAAGGTPPFSYAFSGLPGGCSTPSGASVRCAPTAAGTTEVEVTVSDANGSRASAELLLSVDPDPAVTSFQASPASVTLGDRSVLETAATGGVGPMIYFYNGLPQGCVNQSLPDLPCTSTIAGSFHPAVQVSDGVDTSAAVATTLTVGCAGNLSGPQICSFSVDPTALILGNTTTVSVNATGGTAPLAYRFSGLPPGCSPSPEPTFSCRPSASGTFQVDVTVTDARNATASSSTGLTVYPVGGGEALGISAFTAAPSVVSLGNSTVLELVIVGASENLTYSYEGLPTGCRSADLPMLPCTPSATGTYLTHAVVTDSSGDSAGAYLTIDVVPAIIATPFISLFVATPDIVTVGTNVTFLVSLSRGTPPLTYLYEGLPAGCASASTPTLTCAPAGAGQFTVSVTVSGPSGANSSARTDLIVRPAGAATPTDLLGTPVGDAIGFVAGAVLVAALLETYRRRRQLRREGDEIVRALSREASAGASEPGESTRP